MKLNFSDKELFAKLEESAFDGQLDYSEFPPGEYKYFSLLTRLGYNNRHKGWTKKTCELKQQEFRQDYLAHVEERDEWLNHARTVQQRKGVPPRNGRDLRLSERLLSEQRQRSRQNALRLLLQLGREQQRVLPFKHKIWRGNIKKISKN